MLRGLSGAQSLLLSPVDSGNVVVGTASDTKHFPSDVISCGSARLFPGLCAVLGDRRLLDVLQK